MDLSVFVDLEKNFSPVILWVNFEVLNLHLCMDYCEFALSEEAKGFSWFPGDNFFFFLEIGSSVFVDWYLYSELWIYACIIVKFALNDIYKQRGFHDSQEIDFLISFLFLCLNELNM